MARRSLQRIQRAAAEPFETRRGRADAARLAGLGLRDLELRALESRAALQEKHAHYVETISVSEMAISLELAAVLDALCRTLRFRRVGDLGSGFSSYVLRRYARDTGAEVVSVDSDMHWLERTRELLEREGLPTDSLFEWVDFSAAGPGSFDLILDDLGDRRRRIVTIPYVLELIRTNGFVLFDDRHKPDVRAAVDRECLSRGLDVVSLRTLTLDEFGRYACLAHRPPAQSSLETI